MDRSEILKLIGQSYERDDNGVMKLVDTTEREIFCQVESITRNEFFEAGRNGLNPEYKFLIFFGDYQNERVVEYDGKRYAVYRTFRGKNDVIELYVERQGGTNGAQG